MLRLGYIRLGEIILQLQHKCDKFTRIFQAYSSKDRAHNFITNFYTIKCLN